MVVFVQKAFVSLVQKREDKKAELFTIPDGVEKNIKTKKGKKKSIRRLRMPFLF